MPPGRMLFVRKEQFAMLPILLPHNSWCGFKPQSNRGLTNHPCEEAAQVKALFDHLARSTNYPLNRRNYENESHAIKQQTHGNSIYVPQSIEAFRVYLRGRDFASYGNFILGCRRH